MVDKPHLELIARVVHEAIRAYQTALGEDAAASWEDAELWLKHLTLSGVEFRANNPAAPIAALHDRWALELRQNGWNYGAVKDTHLKTHPSLVPFEQLSQSERRKDVLFGSIVDALTRLD